MLKLFGRYVIGGRSGKREQAWALFVLWAVAFGWMMHREVQGVDLPNTTSVLSLALPLVVANLAIAHGMEWTSTQSKWAPPDNYGDVE
ncbi:hypothetical protein HKX54_02425 [Sulfitobacter sp. M57]|uniref:hypothetical protein n=1 Tax=unclassified Sulfitobacter TaxID=196795 RepID=UPI0023E344CE|nr:MULTISPECIES: hypothetical protein [unclassified Sulfitobacter]MDF3413299.1 hypothetical protein [Sulfitobacter sp. KE5]MDF3421421.1 hypothetical protein [Sulfitobacter sp. KE43]MDF3431846.1 hypothetical protein [Sulfitobacter sp. KE42]MDF3457486.1 hypothetical protein [Sulfitobacter sp. S74]MDF3461388.1 hypothetical protein [Sulfitobacter sp. Ks18]